MWLWLYVVQDEGTPEPYDDTTGEGAVGFDQWFFTSRTEAERFIAESGPGFGIYTIHLDKIEIEK